MPRLIDRLDAAVGLLPHTVEPGVDLLARQPAPDTLFDDEGAYRPGWFDAPPRRIDLERAGALPLAFQRWFHLAIATPDRFVACHVADLTRAANVAVTVVERRERRLRVGSRTLLPPRVHVEADPEHRRLRDRVTGSHVAADGAGGLHFHVHVGELAVAGRAREAWGPPFVQVTPYHRRRGALQVYGHARLEHGLLVLGDEVLPLPAGAAMHYDRTLGHMRGQQAWHWVAATGHARTDDGRRVPLALQVARDRPAARPRVEARKHVVWAEEALYKVPRVAFQDPEDDGDPDEGGGPGSPWRISSPPEDPRRLDLGFTPEVHRWERRHLVLMEADFRQFYGTLAGTVVLDGRRYELEPTWAVVERSRLEI